MQTSPQYATSLPLTVEAFRNRACARPCYDEGYVPPTPDEVKQLRTLLGLSQRQLARFLGANYTQEKGSPTVRKWETALDKASHRQIGHNAWQMMLVAAGVITPTDIITMLDNCKHS